MMRLVLTAWLSLLWVNGAVMFIKFTSERLDTRLCHGLFA
jgi:hypothetical protein